MARRDVKLPEKPDGWDRLSREGSQQGAQVAFCPKRQQNYHVLGNGDIEWHDRPAGSRVEEGASGVPVIVAAGAVLSEDGFGWDQGADEAGEEPDAAAVAAPAEGGSNG